MKPSKIPIFLSLPAIAFLLVAMALLFLRHQPKFQNQPLQTYTYTPQEIDSLHNEVDPIDSLLALPDSLNPFIQMVDLDATTDRVLAVQKCGSCHQEEYQNWSDGPHAYSYRSMRKLYETASDSVLGYFPKAYGTWIQQNMNICFQCHATENLYETNFKGIEYTKSPSLIKEAIFPDLRQMGRPRIDPQTFTTGIDCYTCHFNGERVITGPDFKPDPSKTQMPGYCNPLPSAFFTTNSNCYTCHNFAADTQEANLHSGMEFEETNCIECHQEYDAKNKGTHFFDWRFADRKKHPEEHAKGGLFESMEIQVVQGDVPKLTVDWRNTVSPHGLTECGEVVVEFVVEDQNGKRVLKEDIRLNRKSQHDVHLRKQLFGEEPPGIVGYQFDPSDPPIHEEFPLNGKYIQSGKILVTALDKAQYWGDDKIGVHIYKKEILF